MPSLPAGTVTLLFTDIEGSTRLLQDLGDAYARVLTDHRQLLRGRFEEHGGVVVDTQGDAFFVAFASAGDAVAAAVEAQRDLASHAWPESVTPRVRMAIHTGEPAQMGDGFVGASVHRAARICAIGHGGQILVSSTTRGLVDDKLPRGVVMVDLGEQRLKDFDHPEVIALLVIDGVPPVLTPPKTLEDQPTAATPFAGREEELATAARAVATAPPHERNPAQTLWNVARTRTLDWRQYVRVPGRGQLADRFHGLGLSIYATARIATGEDLRTELRNLGRTLVAAARDARDASELLRREDRRDLARRLARYREQALWDHHLQAADTVAKQIAALTALAEANHGFETEARKLESRVRSLRTRVFDARHDPQLVDELLRETRQIRATVEAVAVHLHAIHRSAVEAFAR